MPRKKAEPEKRSAALKKEIKTLKAYLKETLESLCERNRRIGALGEDVRVQKEFLLKRAARILEFEQEATSAERQIKALEERVSELTVNKRVMTAQITILLEAIRVTATAERNPNQW